MNGKVEIDQSHPNLGKSRTVQFQKSFSYNPKFYHFYSLLDFFPPQCLDTFKRICCSINKKTRIGFYL